MSEHSPSYQENSPCERYYAPNGMFSVNKPSLVAPGYIDESFSVGMAPTVVFRDDLGTLVRIEVIQLAPEQMFVHSLPRENQDEICKNIYDDVVEVNIRSISPEAKTIYRAEVNEPQFHGYYAVLQVPGASSLVDVSTGKRADSTRGYLLSLEGDQLVIISCQDTILGSLTSALTPEQRLYGILVKIRETYKNEAFSQS